MGSERAVRFVERKETESKQVQAIRKEERLKQRLETARFVEKARGERKRKFAKEGGFLGVLGRAAAARTQPVQTITQRKGKRKGKKSTKRTTTTQTSTAPRKMPRLQDFKFEY